jgi:uncharacterized protein YbjQ (UPF0145 family)
MMIVTTTSTLDGQPIKQYLGIVTGEVISGANIVRDIFASVTDVFGGRSGKYEDVLARSREEALGEMKSKAVQMGANAVIGVDIDYEVLGKTGSMLMVSVSGTAVIV